MLQEVQRRKIAHCGRIVVHVSMRISILSWNVWGLNNFQKRAVVKSVINARSPSVVCLQESKLDSCSRQIIRSLWGNRWINWCCLDAQEAARGIILMWDSRMVDKIDSLYGEHSVSCLFKDVETGIHWCFSGVYAPVNYGIGRGLWEELAGVKGIWEVPWCIGRDFNVVRFTQEQHGCNNISRDMKEFSDFIDDFGMLDLPLEGGCFTWFRGGSSTAKPRMDRFLLSPDWEEMLPNVTQVCHPRPIAG